jgi:hypothetical protein
MEFFLARDHTNVVSMKVLNYNTQSEPFLSFLEFLGGPVP